MGTRAAMLFLCIVGLLTACGSLEYLGLIEYAPLGALGFYSIGLLAFVFGVRGVVRS